MDYKKMYEDLKKENEELKKFKQDTEEMCGAFAVTEDLMKKIENQEKEIAQLKYNLDTTQEKLDFVNDKYDYSKKYTYPQCNDYEDDKIRLKISKEFIIFTMITNRLAVNITEEELDEFTELVGENTTNGWLNYVDMDKLIEEMKDDIIFIHRHWEGWRDSDEED